MFLFLGISIVFAFSLFFCGPWSFFNLGHVKKTLYIAIAVIRWRIVSNTAAIQKSVFQREWALDVKWRWR